MVVIHEKEAGVKYIWVQWTEKPVRNDLLSPSCFFIAVCSFSSHINKTFSPSELLLTGCFLFLRPAMVVWDESKKISSFWRPIQSHLNHCFSTFSSPVWTPAAHPNHVHGVAMWATWLANYIIVLMKSWTGVPIKAAVMDMDHYFG